jgi:zeta-carotene isomerase
VGEDAATFALEEQSFEAWVKFAGAGSVVLGGIFYSWIYPGGLGWGDSFKDWMEGMAGGDSTLAITYMLGFFGIIHSGMASLRPMAEEIMGARAWRVLFAIASLPLAFSCLVYFINHRCDGVQLWDLHSQPWLHSFCWLTSFTSFLFIYPSSFNLLEVAAVDKPQLHLWETGIIRITRHPQFVGQVMWCAAHTAYVGSSFMLATSAMLCAHHAFGAWNGDRRLKDEWGERADIVMAKTSVLPFAAILDGRQVLPNDYIMEFARLPYLVITVGTIAAYFAHPFMQAGGALLKW